jgi:hypothetical protein
LRTIPRDVIALAGLLLLAPVAACTEACAGGAPPEAIGASSESATTVDRESAASLAASENGEPVPTSDGSGDAVAIVAEPEPEPEPVCELGTPDGSGGCIVSPADRRAALGPEGRLAHVLTACPDPELGPMLEPWVWHAPPGEREMAALDLGGEGTAFDLLSDFEGTSIILRVRDAASREKLAVIKTTTSNTRVEAEVYAHRLSVFLGFEELVPDVHYVTLDLPTIDKVRELLRGVRYSDERKEARRDRVLRQLWSAREGGTPFRGAMKPWLSAFIFHNGLGQRESLAESDVMRYLRARGPQPTDESVRLRQYTRLYEPLGTHQGEIALWQLAEDLSNIMVLDSLTGQNDRFPGANLHFIATSGQETEIGERRGRPIYDMGTVRLLALDNGAALHDRIGSGIRDLQGDIVGGTRVERFEPETLARLDALGRRLLGRSCDAAPFDDEVEAIWNYLGLEDAEDRALAAGYLERALDYIDDIRNRSGDDALLNPVFLPTEGSGELDSEADLAFSIEAEELLPGDEAPGVALSPVGNEPSN